MASFGKPTNGFISLQQVTPFVITTGYPAGGLLRITDAQGDRVDISADGTRFHYAYFAAGNNSGAPNATADGPVFLN